MSLLTEGAYLKECKQQIADALVLGDDQGVIRKRDLEYLVTAIESKSNVRLSLSTLKRIWKTDYLGTPQPATLDALVALLGYSNWQAFRMAYDAAQEADLPEVSSRFPIGFAVAIAVMGLISFYAISSTRPVKPAAPIMPIEVQGAVSFTANKTVDVGLPNTVVFEYDVTQIQADSFFIQQSWNPDFKDQIDPAHHFFSSMYYTPGHHVARLMANDSVMKYQPVHILSDGWMPIVKYDARDKLPIYIPPDKLSTEGVGPLSLKQQDLVDVGVDFSREFKLRYYYVDVFDGLSTSNFTLRTKLRCDRMGTNLCPSAQILIIGDGNVFYVPLIAKGCEADLNMLVGEEYWSSRSHDMSALGVDMYEWQTLEWSVQDKQVAIVLNDSTVFDFSFEDDFGEIKGLIYTFNTLGSVAYTELIDSDGVDRLKMGVFEGRAK